VKPQDERSDSWGSPTLTPNSTPKGRGETAVGGIDFGWRNPFAAIWGVLDHDDVLWITHERYLRETPLSDHAAALPRDVMSHAGRARPARRKPDRCPQSCPGGVALSGLTARAAVSRQHAAGSRAESRADR